MGSSGICRCEYSKCLAISQDIEIEDSIQIIDEDFRKFKVSTFSVVYYYPSTSILMASYLVNIANFIPPINLITLPLSIDRDFAHAGLVIKCGDNLFYSTHKTTEMIKFYKVPNETEGIMSMNTLPLENYPDQQIYKYFCKAKDEITINDVRNFIKKIKKIYNLWSNNCQHYIKDILNKFKK